MKGLIAGLGFLVSLAAFLVVVGGGLFLFVVENSGERGAGALLALSGSIAFGAATVVAFGRGMFARRGGRSGAVICTFLGILPPAALAIIALRISGLPPESDAPLVDWSIFAVGFGFALGALALAATGYWCAKAAAAHVTGASEPKAKDESSPSATEPVPERAAKPNLAAAMAAASEPEPSPPPPQQNSPASEDDEDIRVTPVVELPSIDPFRRRPGAATE